MRYLNQRLRVSMFTAFLALSIFASAAAAESLTLNPPWQSVQINVNSAAFHLDWSGYGFGPMGFSINYDDSGGGETYQCWSNCASGGTNYSHVYHLMVGDRFPYVQDTNSSPSYMSNFVDVYVYQ
jgi:hypothetical protein